LIETRGDLKDMMNVKGVIILATIEGRVIVNTTIAGINAEVQNQVVSQAKIHIMDNSLHQEVIMIDANPTMVAMVVHVGVVTTKVIGMIIDKIKSLESDVESLIPLNQSFE
jgi:hypothetical protein